VNEAKEESPMTTRTRDVITMQFPGDANAAQRRAFFNKVRHCASRDRPSLVLDCSGLKGLDRDGLLLLLDCLEEAMKRNGDVRLAGVSAAVRSILESAGVHRLFRIFDSIAEAESSFHHRSRAARSTREHSLEAAPSAGDSAA
jgi:anti-sigma B factor antagonist